MSAPLPNEERLRVGQTLWLVPRNGGEREIVLTKVGRKWAEFGDIRYRVNLKTLALDVAGYGQAGQCFLSQDAYSQHLALNKAWADFKALVGNQWGCPPGVSLSQIENARRALFKEKQ